MKDMGKKQPKLVIPVTGLERTLFLIALIVMIWSVVYICVQWPELPETIPIHFDGKGNADGWGSRWTLWILPAISLLLFIGLTWLSRFPHVFNYPVPITEENAARQYRIARQLTGWIRLEIVALFSYIAWSSIQLANGKQDSLGQWTLPIILVVIIGTVAIYLVRAFRTK